jgi:hypothetical protein
VEEPPAIIKLEPNTETPEPMRIKSLTERELPNIKPPKTLAALPDTRRVPKTLTCEPKRARDLTDTEDPRNTLSKELRVPIRAPRQELKLLPSLTKLEPDKEELIIPPKSEPPDTDIPPFPDIQSLTLISTDRDS